MIENKSFDEERALYNLTDETVKGCVFGGPADGESAFKEARNIKVFDTLFELRYPLWHVQTMELDNITMVETCRAALWYTVDGVIRNSSLGGIKALRECKNIKLEDCTVKSPEFGWKSSDISMERTSVESEYLFLDSSNISLKDVKLKGKYSFQYVKNLKIEDSNLDTKDAFWHAENVTVVNSTIKGEYLGWFSKNLTLIDCHIEGTQPLCYCENLVLKNCTMEKCDLAFEYSQVDADVKGYVDSVKNPRSGRIVLDSVGEIIRDNPVMECTGEVICRE